MCYYYYIFPTEKQPCYPNPCKHNGTCIETDENSFMCDCDGITYTGETCDVLLIDVPEFSALTVDSPVEASLSSHPDREFMLYLEPDDGESLKVRPKSIMFSQEHTHHNVTVKGKKPGRYTLNYRVKDQTLNYQPVPAATLLVINGTVNKSDYFDKYGVKPGVLQPGCCVNHIPLHSQCPNSLQIFLKSSCGWKANGTYSPGIIFSSGIDGRFHMPVAIAGAKVKLRKSGIYRDLLNLNNGEFEGNCMDCSNGSDGNVINHNKKCNNNPLSLNDVQSFLCHESLASTYFYHSSRLTPKWLKLNALSSNRTHDAHSYMVDLVYPEEIKIIKECSKLTTVNNGLYSVMLYGGSLEVKIDKESVQFHSDGSKFCYAVNLCEGASSPLYIAIPDEAQMVLKSTEFMRDLESKGWDIIVNGIALTDSKINVMSDIVKYIPYWNGNQFFISYKRRPNMLTNTEFTKLFSRDDTVKAKWDFSGNVYFFHDNINKVRIYILLSTC